ncbi:hypothetical protein [Hahella sp. CCB-MM4]|uniref:hypothetical protein n=1 Tax=Hahella sp. (strain CCB-MM4) TaxID=1926491 RepID=UPI0011404279|nr:hypothetical protein [Hahella sp. CCB-MM4]
MLTLLAPLAYSHHSFMSFFNLIKGVDSQWRLTAVLSQSGVTTQLQHTGPETDTTDTEETTTSEISMERQLTEYLDSTIEISLDGKRVILTPESVDLGNHETRVIFVLQGAPSEFNLLEASIRSFADDKNHHNILTLVQGSKRNRQILSARNNFSASIEVGSYRDTE